MAARILEMPARDVFECPADYITQGSPTFRMQIAEHLPIRPMLSKEQAATAAGLGCVRGTAMALFAEAFSLVCVYGAWQVCHMLMR